MPVPVPPETRMLARARTHAARKSSVAATERAKTDQVFGCQQLARELSDRQRRTVHRQRRDDRVDARAVGQARVDHGRRVVEAAADRPQDLVDDVQDVGVVAERRVGAVDDAAALEVDPVPGVDHDLGDRRVAQQRLERPEAEHLVGDLRGQPQALLTPERHRRSGRCASSAACSTARRAGEVKLSRRRAARDRARGSAPRAPAPSARSSASLRARCDGRAAPQPGGWSWRRRREHRASRPRMAVDRPGDGWPAVARAGGGSECSRSDMRARASFRRSVAIARRRHGSQPSRGCDGHARRAGERSVGCPRLRRDLGWASTTGLPMAAPCIAA